MVDPVNVEKGPNEAMDKIQGFVEAAMQAVTADMVNDIATKVVSMIEVVDDVAQPETINLLKKLPEVSENLDRTLDKLKQVEENGTLDTLFQFADLIGSMKQSMTGPMISEMVEKGIQGVEFLDDVVQKDGLQLVDGMVSAFHQATKDQEGKEAMSTLKILRALSDQETREGLSLLLSFVKFLPKEMKQESK